MQSLWNSILQLTAHDATRVGIFAVGGAVIGILIGRGRILILSLATYVALALVTNAPWISFLQTVFLVFRNPYAGLIWFGSLYGVTVLILWRSHWLETLIYDRGSWWEASVFGLVHLGCVMSCILLFMPDVQGIRTWSPVLIELFGTIYARSFWLSAPLLLMALRAIPRSLGRVRDLQDFANEG